jgi:hypothetical protein
LLTLLQYQPVAYALTQTLDTFNALNASNEFRAKQAMVSSLVRKPPDCRQLKVNGSWRRSQTFQVQPVLKDNLSVKGQSWL